MARTRWKDLSPTAKGGIVATAAVDAGLRAWAGADLASRSADELNGPKWAWAAALAVVNSAGVLPVVYLLVGRKK